MNKKTLTALIVALVMLHGASMPAHEHARAQEAAATPARPAPGSGSSVSINNQAGRVQIKLERGSRVAVSNRYGRITITGWDGDTVEATASSERGAEAVQVEMTADPAAARSVLTLTVPGRPGQRAPFPYVYMPGITIDPRIYTIPNVIPPNLPNVAPAPRAYPAPSPTPGMTPPPPASRAKPVKVKPRGNVQDDEENDGNVVILPVPGIAQAPAAGGGAAVAPRQPSTAVRGAARAGGGTTTSGGGAGGGFGSGGGQSSGASISLNVRMPRYALLDAIEVRSGDVNISDIDGPVSISSGSTSNNITVNRVGALEVRARSGNINVDGVGGLVYIVATSGKIIVRRAGGDVRATSINGDIDIQCVRGRVDASNARGGIVLNAIEGDVEASTTDADINFTGAIRRQGRYRLKSMEGRVIMAIPEGSPGFTATLASYNNDVVTTFPVTTEVLAGGSARVNRRVVVKQGDGDTQIMLDSFSQPVYLSKLASGAPVACK
ncbi:MAG TPA: hypothetical protein VEZ40_17305 [Pyrinomonadaceae bacterium]|nr:hypothetical protein [Pyrinomonadaceae bacterium]